MNSIMEHSQKINQIVSVLVNNSILPTRNDLVAKLPVQIEGIEKEALEEMLTQIYRKAVESRGIEFQDITGTEVGAKIQKVVEWMTGSPVRSGLIFQGTIGSGKTTLTYAMYGLYKQLASPVIYTTAYDLHTQFKHYLEKEDSRYEEILKAKYLFLDELGSEPERCQSYGTDYTPVQNLISYRYDRKLPTVVTTNLADDNILDRYGPRMMDRINEMFSILRFKGDSYRK